MKARSAPLICCFAVAFLLLAASSCLSWDNACYAGPVMAMPFPREIRSTVILDPRRVVSVEGDFIVYDIGRGTVLIRANEIAGRSFLANLKKGRCNARETVVIEPDGKALESGRFKTVTPGPH
jgi:hypothetical protein